MDMNELPDDMVQYIADFCPPWDVVALSQTCRRFSSLCLGSKLCDDETVYYLQGLRLTRLMRLITPENVERIWPYVKHDYQRMRVRAACFPHLSLDQQIQVLPNVNDVDGFSFGRVFFERIGTMLWPTRGGTQQLSADQVLSVITRCARSALSESEFTTTIAVIRSYANLVPRRIILAADVVARMLEQCDETLNGDELCSLFTNDILETDELSVSAWESARMMAMRVALYTGSTVFIRAVTLEYVLDKILTGEKFTLCSRYVSADFLGTLMAETSECRIVRAFFSMLDEIDVVAEQERIVCMNVSFIEHVMWISYHMFQQKSWWAGEHASYWLVFAATLQHRPQVICSTAILNLIRHLMMYWARWHEIALPLLRDSLSRIREHVKDVSTMNLLEFLVCDKVPTIELEQTWRMLSVWQQHTRHVLLLDDMALFCLRHRPERLPLFVLNATEIRKYRLDKEEKMRAYLHLYTRSKWPMSAREIYDLVGNTLDCVRGDDVFVACLAFFSRVSPELVLLCKIRYLRSGAPLSTVWPLMTSDERDLLDMVRSDNLRLFPSSCIVQLYDQSTLEVSFDDDFRYCATCLIHDSLTHGARWVFDLLRMQTADVVEFLDVCMRLYDTAGAIIRTRIDTNGEYLWGIIRAVGWWRSPIACSQAICERLYARYHSQTCGPVYFNVRGFQLAWLRRTIVCKTS